MAAGRWRALGELMVTTVDAIFFGDGARDQAVAVDGLGEESDDVLRCEAWNLPAEIGRAHV